MSKSATGRLETLSNIAVIVAALMLCVILARREWFAPPEGGSPRSLQGTTIDLASLTPHPAERNLLLVVSQTCHFCEQEMPFYKQLGELPTDGRLSVLAVFPPHERESEKFLAERSVRVDRVAADDFARLGVRGTPTIMIVDAHGKVERAWIGALQPRQHEEVLAALRKPLLAMNEDVDNRREHP